MRMATIGAAKRVSRCNEATLEYSQEAAEEAYVAKELDGERGDAVNQGARKYSLSG